MCPNDSLPIPGRIARAQVIRQVKRACEQPNVPYPEFDWALPVEATTDSGALLDSVRKQAKLLTEALYFRIDDKGVGLMWGFCKQWAWDQLEGFVAEEGYIP